MSTWAKTSVSPIEFIRSKLYIYSAHVTVDSSAPLKQEVNARCLGWCDGAWLGRPARRPNGKLGNYVFVTKSRIRIHHIYKSAVISADVWRSCGADSVMFRDAHFVRSRWNIVLGVGAIKIWIKYGLTEAVFFTPRDPVSSKIVRLSW